MQLAPSFFGRSTYSFYRTNRYRITFSVKLHLKTKLVRVERFPYFYQVKSIALLLSIIVLALTTVPCCALEERDTHAHQKEQKKEQHQCSEQQKNECCKDCSPFYVCGTCIGFTATAQILFVFQLSIVF